MYYIFFLLILFALISLKMEITTGMLACVFVIVTVITSWIVFFNVKEKQITERNNEIREIQKVKSLCWSRNFLSFYRA